MNDFDIATLALLALGLVGGGVTKGFAGSGLPTVSVASMGNGDGKEVDFHAIVLDDEGNGLYGPPEAGEGMYPAEALQGRETVDGLPVRYISPEF